MRAILIQQGLDSALDKTHNTVILHLFLKWIAEKYQKKRLTSGLWTKLKELLLKKSLAKRLSMNRRLYTFSIEERVAMKGSFG